MLAIIYLVRKSSGQFIYTSTVMKYIESHHHWPTISYLELSAVESPTLMDCIGKTLTVFSVLLLMNPTVYLKSLWPSLKTLSVYGDMPSMQIFLLDQTQPGKYYINQARHPIRSTPRTVPDFATSHTSSSALTMH